MAVAPELGELGDIAKAIGLVDGAGALNPDWFGDPGKFTGRMLRDPAQRTALLHGLDTLLGEDQDVFLDEKGRSWVLIVDKGGVALHLVVEVDGGATLLGIGARLRTNQPASLTEALVPLVRIPDGAAVQVVPGSANGRVHVRTEVTLDGAPPAPGKPALAGLAFDIDVAADGTTPKLSVVLRGLQFPGEQAPRDLVVDPLAPPATLGDQALKLVVGLVQSAAKTATGPLAELLALVGLSSDPAIPPLPVAKILQQGVSAWRDWLNELIQRQAAIEAWLGHLAKLVGVQPPALQALAAAPPGVTPPSGPGEPYRIPWTVANGIALAATVKIGTTATGVPEVELGVEARADKPGTLPAALELTAALARITLGPGAAVRALPRLDLLGRAGPATGGNPLLDTTTPQIGTTPPHVVRARSLRVGFALDAGRKPVFVLAAHEVTIAAHSYPVLDLTNTQTLADVGKGALEDIAGDLLHRLGPAEQPVRVLLGLSAPPGDPAWPAPLTKLPDLLANPVRAVASYHDRVLKTNRGGYPKLLEPLGALLLSAGGGGPLAVAATAVGHDGDAVGVGVPGDDVDALGGGVPGDEATPWRVPLAEGVALTAWADGDLHLGIAVDRSMTDLGGGCPTVALTIGAELARFRLDALAGQALPGVSAQLKFGARGGAPLRIGERDAALVAEAIGISLRWAAGGPLRAKLEAPGLAAAIDGRETPVELPRIAADGSFEVSPPWEALELLSGHLLRRTGMPWATAAVDLLGWLPEDAGPASPARLPLEALASDPVRALRGWAVGTAVPRVAEWVALLASGPAGPGLSTGVAPGRGDADSPHEIALTAAAAGAAPRRARVLLWSRAGHQPPVDAFRPGTLLGWLSAPPGTKAPTAEQLAAPLRDAAEHGRTAADVMDGRQGIAAGFSGLLARWTDTDGLVTAANAVLPGATVHDLDGVGQLDLPAAIDLAALGLPSTPAVVFVTGPFGPGAWPGVPSDHVVDLRTPGLAPEAFEVTRLASSDGPWAVRLPRRAEAATAPGDDGFARQVARLARAVDAVVARAGGASPVVLVAHGAAGHAAARVAATRPGVTHLVTVGTAHGGLALQALDTPPVADALRLFTALIPDADPNRPEHPAVVLGRALLAPLRAAYDATAPLDDLAPPPAGPPIPGTVSVHCVRGRVSADGASRGLAGLVVRGLQEAFEADAGPPVDGIPGLATGLALQLEPVTAVGAVRVRSSLAVALPGPGTPAGAGRALRLRFEIDRVGGWLAGGPDPARPPGMPRAPSLRRATLELDVPFGTGAPAPHARIILHEGEALGIRRRRWELTGGGDPMVPEARVLMGLMAGALGPLPAAGPVRDLVDLLAAVGITEPGTSQATGAPVSLSVDGVRQLLLDPAALVAGAQPAALAAVLARITGAPPPPAAAPARLTFSVDGVAVLADVAARTLRVQDTLGLALPVGTLRGTLDVAGDGTIGGSGVLTLGGGLSIEASATAPSARLLLADGRPGGLPASVALYPQTDIAGLRRLVVALAPAELLWAGITFIRSLKQSGVDAVVDPLLRAVKLLRPDGRVVVPMVLLADPGRWFSRLASGLILRFGVPAQDGHAAAFDALGALLGIPRPRSGAWLLPYGLELSVTGGAFGIVRLMASVPVPPADAALQISGSVSLVTGGGVVVPQASIALGIPGAPGRLTLGVGATGTTGATARLTVPSLGLDVALLPPGSGLAGSAAAAVLHALPVLLDALAALPAGSPGFPVGQAVATLGDRLGLRFVGARADDPARVAFSADQIAQLAAAPGPQLATRLSANLPLGLAALRDLLAPMLPAFLTLTATATDLTLARTGQTSFTVSLSVPSAAGVRVAAALKGRKPFTGATLDADVAVDAAGLSVAHVLLDVKPAAPVKVGPLSLAPQIDLAVGPAAVGGPHLAVGLAVPDAVVSGVLRPGPPRTFAVESSKAPLADAVALLLLPLALELALSTSAMTQLLAKPVLGTTLKNRLEGVVFLNGAFDPGATRPTETWTRLLKLGVNIATAPKAPKLELAPLTIGVSKRSEATRDLLGISVTLPPGQRVDLVDGDVTVQAEVDATWVRPTNLTPGLTVELLDIPKPPAPPKPFILVALRGLGLRVARKGGPLIDGFVVADSVAAHGLIEVQAGQTPVGAAGGQLELSGLRLPLGSAKSDTNKVASGIMRDSASGSEPLAPKFSPAFAIQRRPADGLRIDLRAGDGDGPWFLPIQRGFGPVYVEQVGFGVTRENNRVKAARVLVDGRVSLLGLTVAVDDLGLTAPWPQAAGAPAITNPASWTLDLAGLAVAADTSGLSISGGLRRASPAVPDYVGMISLRFGPYALSAYGGYAVLSDNQGNFTSLFIYAALRAPIGGPPAFFVTGIGAGVGVNRLLKLPAQLNDLTQYPLVQSLYPGSAMPEDPMLALEKLRGFFPPERGAFWFAAGVSFNSFALVDCVAVLGVAISDGLELTLIGVARAGLPRPEAPLAQLELALLVRFSSREGVLWVQAQLTDNSWLLTKDVRLTGGFAYVSWFKGDKAGEFVLTVGGYHPSFHRDGYPVVPRVGFRWGVSKLLVIKGESYFAITSEAIMAGTRFEASLTAGPLWAYLRLGADGIIFFDPFRFEVTAFAELGAGITIDINLGIFGHIRFTIGFHLHADVFLAGPNFHGTATIDLGVASATIAFGDDSGPAALPLTSQEFRGKYLQPGGARVLTAVPGRGQATPSTAGSKKPPTGAAGDPFLLQAEFDLTVTTTAATSELAIAGAAVAAVPGADPLAIGPMQLAAVTSRLSISITGSGAEHASKFTRQTTVGQFPKGVWGPQAPEKPLPKGETLTAGTGVQLTAQVKLGPGVSPIEYHQVEIGARKANPLLTAMLHPPVPAGESPAPATVADVLALARQWMLEGPVGTPLTPVAAATFRSARKAPPQLVPLTFGIGTPPPDQVDAPEMPPQEPLRRTSGNGSAPPTVRAVLRFDSSPTARPRPRTTVGEAGEGLTRVAPPAVGALAAARERQDERLPLALELRPPVNVAPGWDGIGDELRRGKGIPSAASARLADLDDGVSQDGIDVAAGEVIVLAVPGAERDDAARRPAVLVQGGQTRVVALDTVGGVVRDAGLSQGAVALPPRTASVALIGGGSPADAAAGWSSLTTVVQIGGRALAGPGCTIESTAVSTRRRRQAVSTAFVRAAEAVAGFSVVTTRLPASTRSLAIQLEQGESDGDLTLELGITGAETVGEPIEILDGDTTTTVYALAERDEPAAVAVTVASGRDLHLAGVVGSVLDAPALADVLAERGIDALLGTLVPSPEASARVSWASSDTAPAPTKEPATR